MRSIDFDISLAKGYVDFEALYTGSNTDRPLVVVNATRANCVSAFVKKVFHCCWLMADFDGTLTMGSQWDDARNLMGPERAEVDRVALKRWTESDRSFQSECEFIFGTVDLLCESGLTQGQLFAVARAQRPRPGALELLHSFELSVDGSEYPDHIVRSFIVSYGMDCYICEWASHNGVFAKVLALKLRWDKDSKLIGYYADTVVVGTNKGNKAKEVHERFGVIPSLQLVLADAPSDKDLFHDKSVNVLILPHTEVEEAISKFRRKGLPDVWNLVDAILVGDSLEPLYEMRRNHTAVAKLGQ
ncbi:MAG: hypothetical protein Q8P30_00295 [Candidatus Uhrbacteria bacterium]|nr:hypothetical protein [Candidatus Uhrbacteria bacterium]